MQKSFDQKLQLNKLEERTFGTPCTPDEWLLSIVKTNLPEFKDIWKVNEDSIIIRSIDF